MTGVGRNTPEADGDAPGKTSSAVPHGAMDQDAAHTHLGPRVARVVFAEPGKVVVDESEGQRDGELKSHELAVRTLFSAVSAGTEMLVYRGEMPDDIPTDATLGGADGEQARQPFSYPQAYGYANVGVVERSGELVNASHPPGSLVFSFREHVSWFIEDARNVQIVPSNVAPQDATFLPNVETAISLAMDAAPLPGESVAVIGQGIVGLLLVSVLRMSFPKCRVIAVDTNSGRLETAAACADADATIQVPASSREEQNGQASFSRALRAAIPHPDAPRVDVSVDVTGRGEGLDRAIEATRDGGRIVLGSWYGAKTVVLSNLGGRFHRSHIQLIASQVSHIPAALASRWDKSRRFRLAWSTLADIKPATRFPVRCASLQDAPTVYAEIAEGRHLQVLFSYDDRSASADIFR